MSKYAKAAAPVFEKNPDLKELFFTNDGQCFSKKNYAEAHAKEIGSKEVISVKKGGKEEPEAEAPAAEPSMNGAEVAAATASGKKKEKK